MKVNGTPYRTIWLDREGTGLVQAINQLYLPHRFVVEDLETSDQVVTAIKEMHVRGAPLIGVAAAWGMYLASKEAGKAVDPLSYLRSAAERLKATRPTAVNLAWAVDRILNELVACPDKDTFCERALALASRMADEEVERCRLIGEHGIRVIEEISRHKKAGPVNILTHCNAGWLACIDYGTATAPIYLAHERGIPIHVWVDETRPRNQGASLTAWELLQCGVPHTIIADNAGGHLMQHGMVDMVITGADRVTRCGDAANKIGTYLKALAATDNGVPFYVALPSSTFDWTIEDGIREIPIEKRDEREVKYIEGLHGSEIVKVLLTPEQSCACNYGFDVTPARLITGLITERGICGACRDEIKRLFPDAC